MSHDQDFSLIRKEFLRFITQGVTWLDRIVADHHVLAIDALPGIFLIAKKGTSPQELATMLAIRHFENAASASFVLGYQTQVERKQAGGVLQ